MEIVLTGYNYNPISLTIHYSLEIRSAHFSPAPVNGEFAESEVIAVAQAANRGEVWGKSDVIAVVNTLLALPDTVQVVVAA